MRAFPAEQEAWLAQLSPAEQGKARACEDLHFVVFPSEGSGLSEGLEVRGYTCFDAITREVRVNYNPFHHGMWYGRDFAKVYADAQDSLMRRAEQTKSYRGWP